jgi:hypothetical protein
MAVWRKKGSIGIDIGITTALALASTSDLWAWLLQSGGKIIW